MDKKIKDTEKVAVSYKIKKETKNKIDELKKTHGITATELIDELFLFDSNACNKFIKIINLLHNPENKKRYEFCENGMIVLNRETSDKINNHKEILNLTDDEIYQYKINNLVKQEEDRKSELDENKQKPITIAQYEKLEKRIINLELLYTTQSARVKDMQFKLGKTYEALDEVEETLIFLLDQEKKH